MKTEMGPDETGPEAASLARLAAVGYAIEFRADEASRTLETPDGRRYRPEDLVIDHVARIEHGTDPAGQAIVFGLRSARYGTRGTYCVPYGPIMSRVDAFIVDRLDRRGERTDASRAASGVGDTGEP